MYRLCYIIIMVDTFNHHVSSGIKEPVQNYWQTTQQFLDSIIWQMYKRLYTFFL